MRRDGPRHIHVGLILGNSLVQTELIGAGPNHEQRWSSDCRYVGKALVGIIHKAPDRLQARERIVPLFETPQRHLVVFTVLLISDTLDTQVAEVVGRTIVMERDRLNRCLDGGGASIQRRGPRALILEKIVEPAIDSTWCAPDLIASNERGVDGWPRSS